MVVAQCGKDIEETHSFGFQYTEEEAPLWSSKRLMIAVATTVEAVWERPLVEKPPNFWTKEKGK